MNYRRGVIALVVLVFLGVSVLIGVAFIAFITATVRHERRVVDEATGLSLAEAGIDRAIAQLDASPTYTGETDLTLPTGTVSVVVSSIDSETKHVTATGYVPSRGTARVSRSVSAIVTINPYVISFHYGIQAGNGGFSLANSSSVIGDVYAGGSITGSGNYIRGNIFSSGSSGLVYGIHATSSVYAHTIGSASQNTIIDKDAHYVTLVNTTVGGTSYPNSADQPSVPLPISDDQISRWETDAAAGGTISSCDSSGNYTITGSVTLGPKKITCNLVIKSSSGVLDVTGPLWITGNITAQTGPTIQMDPSLGSRNVPIIADNPSNETGSGLISVGQSTVFKNSGSIGSYVFLISQNNSAENGGSAIAIALSQGASALVAYASHGLITLNQSVSIKEVTAYKVSLAQTANVTFDTGLPSTTFQAGPGGYWGFATGTYSILK